MDHESYADVIYQIMFRFEVCRATMTGTLEWRQHVTNLALFNTHNERIYVRYSSAKDCAETYHFLLSSSSR
jgi:hypothetical protein